MDPMTPAARACPWTAPPQASAADASGKPSPEGPWSALNRLGQALNDGLKTMQGDAIAVDPTWLMAIATPPMLGALASARALSSALDHLGASSEELFRGDRLPVLHLNDPRDRAIAPPQSPGAP